MGSVAALGVLPRMLGGAHGAPAAPATVRAPPTEQPPPPPTQQPPVEVLVLASDDAEISQLRAAPAHGDPDLVAADEADDVGESRPRQFLGASDDGTLGAPEPVADVTPMPTASPEPVGADCSPKAWQAKNLPAFKDKDTLTDEFREHFERLPVPKKTPWQGAAADFQNTEHADAQPEPAGPRGGLNRAFWHDMTKHGHDHDCPTR